MQEQLPWGDCPPGMMVEMAGQLRRRKRQKQFRSIVAIGVTAIVFVGIGYAVLRSGSSRRVRLTCSQAILLFAKYHDRTLDADQAKEVHAHLSHCPSCRREYEERFPREVRHQQSTESRRLATVQPRGVRIPRDGSNWREFHFRWFELAPDRPRYVWIGQSEDWDLFRLRPLAAAFSSCQDGTRSDW